MWFIASTTYRRMISLDLQIAVALRVEAPSAAPARDKMPKCGLTSATVNVMHC